MATGPAEERLRSVARPLMHRFDGHRVGLCLLDSPIPGAYAWPSGKIYVTRGLVEILADDELAAAVAHEFGHLLGNGNMPPPASLRGCAKEKARDEESRADALGVQLLRVSGFDPQAMTWMLAKLAADPSLSEHCRASILQRKERLSSSTAILPGHQ